MMKNDVLYGKNSGIAVPTAYLTNPCAWDAYMGTIWSALLDSFNLEAQYAYATIVELGPGSATKIGSALAKLKFSGNFSMSLSLQPPP